MEERKRREKEEFLTGRREARPAAANEVPVHRPTQNHFKLLNNRKYAEHGMNGIFLPKRMSGKNDAAMTAKIHVWWDMKDCPVPEGIDALRVRPSIEGGFKEQGYSP
ncbi:hypothetical protein YC2023_020671 [Brassica napus]